MTNELPENIVLNVQPESAVKEFIQIRHGESQCEQKVHIRTVMSSNDTELKLSLLNALYRERITTDAVKTDVLEKLSSKVEFLRDKLVDTQGELKRIKKAYDKESLRVAISDLEDIIKKQKDKLAIAEAEQATKEPVIKNLESQLRIAKSNYEEAKLVIQEQWDRIRDTQNAKPWYKKLFGG